MNGISTMVHRRQRRSPADMDRIREAMIRLARDNRPMTIRQLFYLRDRKKLVVTNQRREGMIPG
jgi:hypothetical protein